MTLFSPKQTIAFYSIYNVTLMQPLMNKWSSVGHPAPDFT